MGSIASGDDGGGAGDWKGITALSLNNVDGTVGRAPPRRARLSRFVLRDSIRRLYANACFPAPGCLQLGPMNPLGCRWTARNTDVKQRVLGRRRSVAGQPRLPGRRSTDRPDTGSALPIRARLIRSSRIFVRHIRVRRGCDAQPRKVAENRHFAKTRQRCSRIVASKSGRKALCTRA